MEFVLYFLIFLLGAIIGSFLNVLVVRLGTGMGYGKRSFCFTCGRQLRPYELVPIVSFLIQKGKCRSCKSKISWQYPTVELLSGVVFWAVCIKLFPSAIFVSSIFNFQFSIFNTVLFVYYAVVFSLLLAISVYDIKHKIIPNQFVYPFIALSFLSVLGIENWILIENWSLKIENLIAGPALFAPLALLWFVSRGRWMGFGDAKLALGIGWLLGLSQGGAAFFISFWAGALVGIFLISMRIFFPLLFEGKPYTIKYEIPFGPFLAFGAFLAYFLNIEFFHLMFL